VEPHRRTDAGGHLLTIVGLMPIGFAHRRWGYAGGIFWIVGYALIDHGSWQSHSRRIWA